MGRGRMAWGDVHSRCSISVCCSGNPQVGSLGLGGGTGALSPDVLSIWSTGSSQSRALDTGRLSPGSAHPHSLTHSFSCIK